MKTSTKVNWESFWNEKKNVSDVYSNSDRVKINLQRVTDINGKNILEIGAGTGRDSFYMIDDGGKLFLLDYSHNSLKIIRDIIPQGKSVSTIGGDAFSLPFADESFDIIFHQGLLEHFRPVEAEKLLRENVRVLKNGGLLLVDVPQRYHVYTIIKHILILVNAWFAGWEREFSVAELSVLLKKLNLTIVHSYGEWMNPSLFYRMVREGFLRAGIKLPLFPPRIPILTNIRRSIRNLFEGTSLQKNTALSIGIIAQK